MKSGNKKTKWLLLVLSAFLVILPGCREQGVQKAEVEAAKTYLVDRGYVVKSSQGLVREYTLSKDLLTRMPYMDEWMLQTVDPAMFVGHRIRVLRYVVVNHPLDSYKYRDRSGRLITAGKTVVNVFMVDGSPVGGTALPLVDDAAWMGGAYSIDGKTIEEVHPDEYVDWGQWLAAWLNNFK